MTGPIVGWLRGLLADRELIGNAGALVIGSGATAVLGLAYWLIAARELPATSVGLAAGVIALLSTLGLIGDFGLGTYLVGGNSRTLTAKTIWGALLTSAAAGAVVGLLAVGAIHLADPQLIPAVDTPGRVAFFIFSAGLTSFSLILDQAFIGLLDAKRLMYRNLLFSVSKLVLLAAVARVTSGQASAFDIIATWMVGKLIATAVLLLSHPLLGGSSWRSATFSHIALSRGTVISHHGLNLSSQFAGQMMPVVVASLLGAADSAAFYAAWMLLQVAALVPSALTTVLYSVATKQPKDVPKRLRLSLALSAVYAGVAIVGFALLGQFALRIFHPEYANVMAGSIELFGFGLAGLAVKFHFIAVMRIANRQWTGTWIFALGCVLELGLATYGALHHGMYGLVLGWLLGQSASILVMVRPLLEPLRRSS